MIHEGRETVSLCGGDWISIDCGNGWHFVMLTPSEARRASKKLEEFADYVDAKKKAGAK